MNSYFIYLFLSCLQFYGISCQQEWIEQPHYTEVNPGETVILSCIIANKIGECRWEKNGTPVGLYPSKYEWFKTPESGDCSLKILEAHWEFDEAVWQCQVTSSSFKSKDALISKGAQLLVREKPTKMEIVQDTKQEISALSGEEIQIICIVSGGNPPPTLHWFLNDVALETGHKQENSHSPENPRTWTSMSTLTLRAKVEYNQGILKCVANHPALEEPITSFKIFNVNYPPSVIIHSSPLEYLEDGKDSVTLKCTVNSNPPSTIKWMKEGSTTEIFSHEKEINFNPVTRHSSGVYSCVAENAFGISEPAIVRLDVKYTPIITSIGPGKHIQVYRSNRTILSCKAEGNPEPRYQWLQKLPTQEVLIRGNGQQLLIENITYDHQGEFVCKAINDIRGEERSVQSEPIRLQVCGAPQVNRYNMDEDITVEIGEDAILEVLFCSNPPPKQTWYLGDLGTGSGNNIILAAGTGHGRFMVEKARESSRKDCYISTLRIAKTLISDSHTYMLKVFNEHGSDQHIVKLNVNERTPSLEVLVAVIVGGILTMILFLLMATYCVRMTKRCCEGRNDDYKRSEIESDKTDIVSTHSSTRTYDIKNGNLFLATEQTYINCNDPIFDFYQETLKTNVVDLSSNLNRTKSSSDDLQESGISYNDLRFPKTSNYGSMRIKTRTRV